MSSHDRLRIVIPFLLAIGALAGCDAGSGENGGGETTTAAGEGPVCGLVDDDLVRRMTADKEIGTRGRGIRARSERALEPAQCVVRADGTSVLQVSIGEVDDRAYWRQQLDQEAADQPGVKEYTGDPGVGWGRTYDRGVRADGAGVAVLRGDRLIRVALYHWLDATPRERLALAEEIARNLDGNVTAYDEQHSG